MVRLEAFSCHPDSDLRELTALFSIFQVAISNQGPHIEVKSELIIRLGQIDKYICDAAYNCHLNLARDTLKYIIIKKKTILNYTNLFV